jgi:NADH dehydrogenase [ubiquinone] 1 alpha subcomplex assembly factor 7
MTLREPKSSPTPLTPLAQKLAAQIEASGPISIYDYMAACLYDPEHGYYRRAKPIGREGDFITAPEISQVFGELIGLWACEVWRQMGEPANLRLIELGPGRGTLLADALRALRVAPNFLRNAAIDLVEVSEALRAVQLERLAATGAQLSWHDRLEDVPLGPSIVIANEFLDCLPVRQFVFDETAGGWRERCVDVAANRFKPVPGAAKSLLAAGMAEAKFKSAAEQPDDGAVFEYRPGTADFVRELGKRAAYAPLAALIIDYGYERPSFGETIQAVKQHRFADIFDTPGEADITAHVDFEELKERAEEAGLEVFGPMPMGEWLLRLGLEARASQLLKSASQDEAASLKSGLMRLVDPAQMGVLFKAVALKSGVPRKLLPFS